MLGELAKVRQDIVMADLSLAEIIDTKHAILIHGKGWIDLASP